VLVGPELSILNELLGVVRVRVENRLEFILTLRLKHIHIQVHGVGYEPRRDLKGLGARERKFAQNFASKIEEFLLPAQTQLEFERVVFVDFGADEAIVEEKVVVVARAVEYVDGVVGGQIREGKALGSEALFVVVGAKRGGGGVRVRVRGGGVFVVAHVQEGYHGEEGSLGLSVEYLVLTS
jgi:hypothetical protein